MKGKAMQQVGGSNISGIAQYNERLILQLIRRCGCLTKAEIARITNLSAQTASVIINRLIDEKLLRKQERRYELGKVGQPAVPIALNPSGAYSIGVKIGRRGLDILLINFVGQILQRRSFTYAYPDPDFIFPEIKHSIETLINELTPVQANRLLGIGVAVPYSIGGWQLEADIPDHITTRWNEIDIKATIQAKQTLPVLLVNDATAACIASLEFDNSYKFNNYLYIFIGTFIGGGVIMNRTLYYGSSSNAGAIGSMPVPSSYAPEATTGTTVQLINCASRYLLNKRLQEAGLATDILNTLANQASDAPSIKAKEIFGEWLAHAAPAIAYAIGSAVSIIDFEGVIIDGVLPPELVKTVTDAIRSSMQRLDLEGLTIPKLVAGTIGNDARALGGAFLSFYTNYNPDRNILISGAQNVSHAF